MEKTLSIRFTSDTHGYLYPTSYADTQDRSMGLMKLASAFPKDGNTLIIDGGDTIQGSPMTNLYYRLSKEEQSACLSSDAYGSNPFAAMMNLSGYHFVTLGNHDFNNGVDALYDYLTNLDAICLCCNIRDKEGKLPIAPYAVHQLENGLRVGLVGACSHFVSRWENPKTVEKLIIEDPIEPCRKAFEAIADQCDVSVLIYHGGYELDFETGARLSDTTENQACQLCNELGFDVVLTGHQHIALEGLHYGNSYTVQPTYRAPHACAVTVTVREDGAKEFESHFVLADGECIPGAKELLSPLEEKVQKWLDTPAGYLNMPLDPEMHLVSAANGSPLANFINTVQMAASGAKVSACALPNEFKGLPKEVTIRDVVSTYIYTNTLVVLDLDRATLKAYIERSADYFDHDAQGNLIISDEFLRPKVQHYNYDYFSGIDYVIDTNKPNGERVTSIRIDGHEMAEDEHVGVCINSYRFCGTGGYGMLPGQKVLADVQVDVADAMIEYITRNPQIQIDTKKYATVIG